MIEHGAKDCTIDLYAADKDGVDPVRKHGRHRGQCSVVQDRVGNLTAHKRVGRPARRERHIVCAGHQGELAVAGVVEGQRTIGIEDLVTPVVRLHPLPIVYLLVGVTNEANRRVLLETRKQGIRDQVPFRLGGSEDY